MIKLTNTANKSPLETELIIFVSSFVKSNLGRGPRDVTIKIVDNMLVFILEGILSPMEKNILSSPEGEKIVYEGRRLSTMKVNQKRIKGLEEIIEKKAIDNYESWNLKNDTAVGIVIFDGDIFDR